MDAPTHRRFDPLRDRGQMAALIAEASGVPLAEAERRLDTELRHPGRSVADDFAARGGPRYTAGPGMDAFYATTDAFLYELAVWNRNRLKHGMRKWIGRHMARAGKSLDVLSVGDGLGFDCLHWARAGHRVTYFELPGLGERFARRLFAESGVAMPMLTDPAAIPTGAFDALTCLDVLEHVPDPPAMVRTLASYLRPGGLMYVSAPFQLVLPWYPTHLRASRRYAGSLGLYRQAGLELAGGRVGWDPVVLRKAGGPSAASARAAAGLAVRLAAPVWAAGRFAAWPYAPLHWVRRAMNRPFA
jgi:SAM-dependent methyltransferase